MATASGLRAYFGFAKQSAEGSPTSPTSFPRWLDGAELVPNSKFEDIREGNLNRNVSLVIKNFQNWRGKLPVLPRPIEAGALLAMMFGTGSDTIKTAPASVSATPAAGGSLAQPATYYYKVTALYDGVESRVSTQVSGATDGTNQKITIAWTADPKATGFRVYRGTGSNGQDRYMAVAAGATSLLDDGTVTTVLAAPPSHSATTHVLDLTNAPDWFAWEEGILDIAGSAQLVARVQDCIADTLVIEGDAGKAIRFTLDFQGKKVASFGTSAASPSYESGSPFLYTNGVFRVDGAASPWVRSWKITIRNMVDAEDLQTNDITPATLVWTQQSIEVEYTVVWQNNSQLAKFFLNSGTADSVVVGTGSLGLTCYQGGDNTSANALDFYIPNLAYKGQPVSPKLDGKPIEQTCVGIATVGSLNPLIAYLRNGQSGAY